MVILYHGKEKYLSYKQARAEFSSLIIEKPECEVIEIDAQDCSAENIIQQLETHQLFGSGKIIFLKRLYTRSDRGELTEMIIEGMSEDSSIDLLIWEEQKIPSNTRYHKHILKNHRLYESPELNKRTFLNWAKEEVASRGMSADQSILRELVLRSNYDAERFMNELDKLSILGAKEINLELIKEHITSTFENEIWDLIDAINDGDSGKVMRVIDELLKNKKEPIWILAMIARNLRMIVSTKSLLDQSYDNRAIVSELRIPPFTFNPILESAKGTSYSKLLIMYEKITNLDFQMKTGGIDPILGLTLLSTIISSDRNN